MKLLPKGVREYQVGSLDDVQSRIDQQARLWRSLHNQISVMWNYVMLQNVTPSKRFGQHKRKEAEITRRL
jgi:hypothetical protein